MDYVNTDYGFDFNDSNKGVIRKFVLVMQNVIFNDNNNSVKIDIARRSLNESNELFVDKMKQLGITTVYLTSIGNSIASGFSFNDPAGPLLQRNDALDDLANQNGISIEKRAYARPQNNCDAKTLGYIYQGATQADINKFVRNDYLSPISGMYAGEHKKRQEIVDILDGKIDKSWIVRMFKKIFNISKPPRPLKEKEISSLKRKKAYYDKRFSDIERMVEKFYPEQVAGDMEINDLIKSRGSGLANIIIYNGYTGGFLDKGSRGGLPFVLKGFSDDSKALYAFLSNVFKDNPDAQVYVCGMPCNKKIINEKKINIAFINNKILASICRMFPNCVYVEPVAEHLFYTKDGRIFADVHYNREEYLRLNEKIMQAIADDYDLVKCLVVFDKYFKGLHAQADSGDVDRMLQEKYGEVTSEIRTKYFNDKIDVFFNNYLLEYPLSTEQLKRIIKFFKQAYPSSYFVKSPHYKQNILHGLNSYIEDIRGENKKRSGK